MWRHSTMSIINNTNNYVQINVFAFSLFVSCKAFLKIVVFWMFNVHHSVCNAFSQILSGNSLDADLIITPYRC